jgi:hypothetical protein
MACLDAGIVSRMTMFSWYPEREFVAIYLNTEEYLFGVYFEHVWLLASIFEELGPSKMFG